MSLVSLVASDGFPDVSFNLSSREEGNVILLSKLREREREDNSELRDAVERP
jgi:hypothetical protein